MAKYSNFDLKQRSDVLIGEKHHYKNFLFYEGIPYFELRLSGFRVLMKLNFNYQKEKEEKSMLE